MEIIGLIWMTGVALALSTVLTVIAWFFRRTRPFSFALWVTPPFAIASLIMIRWSVLDASRVCGPDPEWDRCPTALASSAGWASWFFIVILIAALAFVTQIAVTNWLNRHIENKISPSSPAKP